MNYSLYLFGTNKGTYIQYPHDGEDVFLRPLCADTKGSRLTIHRKDSLTHYAFLRQLGTNSSSVFGICLVTNGVHIKNIKVLYQTFEKIFSHIVLSGRILRYTKTGKILYLSDNFALDKGCIEQTEFLVREFVKRDLESYTTQTRRNFSGMIATKVVALEERNDEILKAIEQNSIVNIILNANSSVNYVEQTISKLNDEIRTLTSAIENQKKVNAELSNKLVMEKAKQRNMTWVALLGAAVLILFFVLWNKVLFPSEVTHYETGEFVYYGPIKDKKPHGEGVAFYPEDDADDRRYYIGHFANGERQDSEAMLYYQNGNYFYGAMDGDKLIKGIFYSNSDHSHFEGSFIDNHPYEGTWYYHEESYRLKDGKMEGNDSSLVKQ